MSKRNNKKTSPSDMTPKKKVSLRPLVLLGALLVSYAVVYASYRLFISFLDPEAVMIVYMTLATVLALAYVIYNKGFSKKNITADMLPADWSEEKKIEFIRKNAEREKRSKWMLLLIIPFAFVFIIEVLYLFLWMDNLELLFKGK